LDDGKKGTSLIKSGTLFSDYPASSGKSPKKYVRMVPDFYFQTDLIEIKGDISGRYIRNRLELFIERFIK
jgi:hypothetical protein